MEMLKNSKSSISLTHDQLSNVIHKTTHSCFQHQHHHHYQHYYHNDLIYECNIIFKNKRQTKRRNRSRKISKHKTKTTTTNTTKYQNSLKRSINIFKSIQNNYNNSTSRTIINSLSDICLCACECKVNLKVLHLFNNYLTDICVCFQEKFITLQLVLVIMLSALITCTAQNIDTKLNNSQQKVITSQTFLVTAVNDVDSTTNNSLHTIYCRQRIPNIFPSRAGAENNLKFHMKISRNLRHSRYYHHCFTIQKRHMQFNTRNISVKWLIQVKTNSLDGLNATKTHYQRYENIVYNDEDYNNRSDSSIVISKIPKNNKRNTSTVVIQMKNKIAKDKQKHQLENQNSNIHFYLNNLTGKSVKSFKIKKSYSKISDKTAQEAEIVNYKFHDHIDNYTNSFNHQDVELKNLHKKVNLLTSGNRSLQYVNDQQHVDHTKLIKVVLDGLGLKKVPKMDKVNISQVEYVTKYREYLQRIRTRKCRNLKSETNKETFLRPLEILTIVTKSELLNQHQGLKRQRRNTFEKVLENENKQNRPNPDFKRNRNQSLEERVRNILVLKKKYQKPRSAKGKERDGRKSYTLLKFALEPEILNLSSNDIEEANIRLVLIQSSILAIQNSDSKKFHTQSKNSSCGLSKKKIRKQNVLNVKLFYLRPRGKRMLLDDRKIDIKIDLNKIEETHTQWLQFDVTKALKMSIEEKRLNHVALELQCDNCKRNGARILNEAFNAADDDMTHDNSSEDHQLMPVLNIIGHFDQSQRSVRPHQYESQHGDTNEEAPNVRHYHHQTYKDHNENRQNHRTYCYKDNQRCCRHSMEVTFNEIKGFEFIIQPKVFDAGYCQGRCPPRYNPAHHHALLQSLIWKQNHRKAPRPCCAPSKLVELEVLHVDEKDSNKLKISTWSDMKVAECACS